MKKSKYALLSLAVVISIVLILVGSFKIDKTSGVAETENSDFSACSGLGTYYRLTGNYNLRTGPSTDYRIIRTISSGTQVTIYCFEGEWGYTGEGYINNGGLSRIDPSVYIESFSLNPNPAYRNNNYSGSMSVHVSNLPDAGNRVSVTILDSDGNNAEGKFKITDHPYNGISFSRKNSSVYGSYRVVAYKDGSLIGSRDFTIEKNEFNFNISKYSVKDTYAENEQGEWEFSLTDLTPSSLNIDDFSYVIKKGSTDATGDFNVSVRDGKIIVRNKKRNIVYRDGEFVDENENYTKNGTYSITLTLKDQDNYSSRNNFSKSVSFKINKKSEIIEEDASARQYTRYNIDYTNEDYNIDIIGTTQAGSVLKYVIDEHIGSTTSRVLYTAAEMRQIYPNVHVENMYFESRVQHVEGDLTINPLAINFGNGNIHIVSYTKYSTTPIVTFYEGGTMRTKTIAEFEDEYPSAFEQLKISSYKYSSLGYISQNEFGTESKVVKHIVKIPGRTPIAITGGEIIFTTNFSGFLSSELANFKAELSKMNGSRATVLVETEGDRVVDPNFALEIDESDKWLGKIYLTAKYTANKDEYAGNYRIRFGFGNYNFSAEFTLEDGFVDYTIYSEVDPDGTSEKPLVGQNPGANQKYDYNIGLYMKKTKIDYYNINLNTLGYRIFDRRVDVASDGRYYFYDEIEYVTKVKRIHDGKVYFDLSLDNGATYQTNQSMTISEFASTYSEAYEYFKDYTEGTTATKYYNFDANGNITGDNFALHPVSMYAATADATDMTLKYLDAAKVEHTVEMNNDFKRANAEMYSLISTRFSYNASGGYILGAIRGRRKDNIVYDNLNDHDVTNLFFIKKAGRNTTSSSSADDIQKENEEIARKTITVLPKTEVPAGEYFIYVSAQGLDSIGYLYDDDSADSAIELAIYPELWMRNNHMTSITYENPAYSVTIDDAIESNSVNDLPIAYANAGSTLQFNLTLDYIYNRENFEYHIEYKNNSGKWENADDYFYMEDDIHTSVEVNDSNYSVNKGLTSSSLKLVTNPGVTKKGDYRIVFNYSNNGITMSPVTKEFSITANNYGLTINSEEVVRVKNIGTEDEEFEKFETFYSNQRYDIRIPVHLYTVEHPENLEFELIHDTTGNINPWNSGTKEFRSYTDRNIVAFKYTDLLVEVDEEESIYYLNFSNYVGSSQPQAEEGNYILKAIYQEENGMTAEATFSYKVAEPKREFNAVWEKDKAVSNESEMYFTREIESSYIVGSRLVGDEISYSIEMYKDGRYTDVSSADSDTRYFEITSMKWKDTDIIDNINYYGDMKVNLAVDKAERIFELSDENKFLMVITLSNVRYEVEMPDIRELFRWEIEQVKITGELENDGEKYDVVGFYNNAKPQMNIKLKTPHEENAKFAITQSCSGNVCTPNDDMINFNNRFDIVKHTNNEIVLKMKEDLAPQLKLAIGNYQLVVYYTQTDYNIYDFKVRNEYVSIDFGDTVIETPVKGGISNDLFINKNSTIRIPVNIVGASYDNVTIDISNNNQTINYNHLFNINRSKFINDHVLEITYDSAKEIEAQNYLVMVHKTVDDEIIEDHDVLKFNATYFNYLFNGVTYDPDPAVPNYENGGKIIIDITTDELLTGDYYDDSAIKREFLSNLVINNTEIPENLNDYFEITYSDTDDYNNFKVILRYSKEKQIWPGDYIATFNASKGDYSLQKKCDFFIDTFERTITIDGVDIESNTKDELIHRNTGGSYLVNYTANYEIDTSNLYAKVTSNDGVDVTDKFILDKTSEGIAKLTFDPELHTIDYGIYTVTLTYADPVTHRNNVATTDIIMYGDYKEILIKDMNASTTPIIAENEGQYYTFTLDTSNLSDEEINVMKIRVLDAENNIVASNISSDNVENAFEVIKNNDNTYKVNILPYKARVGSYFVQFLLPASYDPNNLGLQNVSNKLEFTVDETLYDVYITSSNIITQERINDTDDIYDYIGVKGDYTFTSDSPIKDEYSIKVFNKLKLIKEVSVDADTTNTLEKISFSADEISNGDVEFALCIRGLPYTSITKNVLEYIKISELVVVLDHQDITDEVVFDSGDTKTFEFVITPENATNKNLSFKADTEGIAEFDGRTVSIIGTGETNVTVYNKEISKTFKLIVSERLDSTSYEVNQDEKTIFVNHMESKMLSKNEFIRNITHLKSDYRILDKNNNNVTNTTDVIGTDYKITNGSITYTIIVLGDVNGDGIISLVDATQVYRYYRGYANLTGSKRKAAIVSKGSQIRLIDATNLYRFYRGYRNEL